MAAVLLRLLRHQPHVGYVTHRLPVKLAVGETVADTGLVYAHKQLAEINIYIFNTVFKEKNRLS